jgi:hypothetical protein
MQKKHPGVPKWQQKKIRGRYAKQDIFFLALRNMIQKLLQSAVFSLFGLRATM